MELHRAGQITASKCYDVCHTDTEKISKPSLLVTIMQYSQTKSNKYTRYGNDNEPAARKYFAETEDAHHDNLTVNETGFAVHTEYPCIGVSLDGIVTCSCHDMRGLEIKCPYKYQKGLVNWDKDRTFPIDRRNSIRWPSIKCLVQVTFKFSKTISRSVGIFFFHFLYIYI